jgi:hypothetical protein
MRFGLDSTSAVPVGAHHAVGSTVAIRYLSRYSWKVVTRAEYQADKAAGIDTYVVFEDGAQNALGGYDAGKSDAEFALKQGHDILGVPALPACIPCAVDYDPAGNAHLTDPYFDGCAAVLGHDRAGPYGGDEVIRRQADRHFGTLFATYAWSGGRVDPRVVKRGVYQYSNGHVVGGVGVDYNHVYGVDFGQWDRKPTAPLDPHHYSRLTDEGYAWKGRVLPKERPTVIEYDALRHHPFLHRPRLAVLRRDLRDLADHVYFEAHRGWMPAWGGPPSWNAFHRGWRYQALIHRAQGAKLV